MNIFVLPSTYPNEFCPGAGSFTYEQCLELSKLGHKITILDASSYNYRNWNAYSCQKMQKTFDEIGVRYTFHTRGLMTSLLPSLALHSYSMKIRRIYRVACAEQGTPDILIAHFSLPAGFAAIELAKKEKLPCAVIEHYSLFLDDNLHPFTKSKLTEAVENSDAFICVSNSLKQAIEKHTGIKNKIIVIHNIVDRRFTYYTPPEQNPFVFFSAGNLNKNKRFDLLIESFCHAFSADDNVKLRIAGEGEDRSILERLIRQNGRNSQIELLGWVLRDKIADEYKKCHCFVLLSRHETFGIAYREAMAVGRPVLATDNGGIWEEWDNKNGLIVKDDSVGAVAAGLRIIFEHYDSYNTKVISDNCLKVFGSENVISKTNDLLMNVVCI